MTPDTLESKVVRVETRQEEHARLLALTVPLVGQVAVHDQKLDDVKDDVTEGFNSVRAEMTEFKKDVRAELAEIKRDEKTKARERRAIYSGLMLASFGLVGTFVLQLLQGSGHG